MKLELLRTKLLPDRTLGTLYAPGLVLRTLEDTVRADPIPETPANEAKVYGQTAIPDGEYQVIIDFSPRFKTELPHILDVPGFEGIRIHPGNVPEDTHGCILVGRYVGTDNAVKQSRMAFEELMELLEAAYARGDPITIGIKTEVTA